MATPYTLNPGILFWISLSTLALTVHNTAAQWWHNDLGCPPECVISSSSLNVWKIIRNPFYGTGIYFILVCGRLSKDGLKIHEHSLPGFWFFEIF